MYCPLLQGKTGPAGEKGMKGEPGVGQKGDTGRKGGPGFNGEPVSGEGGAGSHVSLSIYKMLHSSVLYCVRTFSCKFLSNTCFYILCACLLLLAYSFSASMFLFTVFCLLVVTG